MSRKLLPEKKSLQIKKSEKTHKKKVCSLRHQLEFFFIGLLVVSMCTITAINFLFLERYYITKKTEVLEAAVNDLQKLKIVTDAEGNSTAEISDSLKRECSENNLTWTIITVDGKEVASEGGNEKMLQARLIGYAYDLDEQKGWTKILDSTDTYVIQQVSDRFVEMDYVESWGVLDNGCFFLIRTPLESIRDSVSISNSFYFFVGILIITVSAVILWAVTKRITNPISELTVLSSRMKNLDFDAKYKCRAGNEIDELGENFNKMSEELEKTISELKSVNNQLQKDIENKIRIDQQRQEFLNNVSHELKTPISAILMSLQLLEDKRVGALNDEQEQLSKSIKENADRLLGITGELLNMTQVEAGKLQMMPKITKPIELIEYAIKANQVQADKFGIQIEVEYPEEKMPKLFVDSEKIAWVLTNLLSNAVRYSKENGRVVIGAKREKEFVELYVQDFGKGIDPRYHQSIFDRYFRVPGTKVQGSGLGLSISKDFVEAHGGTLTVESELGKGSKFIMRLKA